MAGNKSHQNERVSEREVTQYMNDSSSRTFYNEKFKPVYDSGNLEEAMKLLVEGGEGLVNRLKKKERKTMLRYCIVSYNLERKDGR